MIAGPDPCQLVTWQWRRAEAASQAFADKARELGMKTEELEVKHYARNITLAASELTAGDVGHYEELLDECSGCAAGSGTTSSGCATRRRSCCPNVDHNLLADFQQNLSRAGQLHHRA